MLMYVSFFDSLLFFKCGDAEAEQLYVLLLNGCDAIFAPLLLVFGFFDLFLKNKKNKLQIKVFIGSVRFL